ncbi:MAG: DNA polymerase III subunit delta' [Gammaproteobacteria bacterium]|nr:DNA polymerase III subunit delta' [Gammaproteobacteria bacterium]
MNGVYPWHLEQWRRFRAMYGGGRMPHALLVSGPRGIGLTGFARCAARRLLCRNPPEDGVACGQCRPCVLFAAGNHPDFMVVMPAEKARQITVDSIRELIDLIHLKSQYEQYKVALIEPADAMNRSAANSLLKTLEEPPPDSLLILCTHNVGRLPTTIRSRCQRIEFHSVTGPEVERWLEERLPRDSEKARDLLEIAGGSPMLALELSESKSLAQREEVLSDLVSTRSKAFDPAALAGKWTGYGADKVLGWLLGILSRSLRLKLLPSPVDMEKSSINNHLQQLADELDLARLVACYDLVMRGYLAATGPFNLNSQSLLEEVIIRWRAVCEPNRR